MEEGANEVGLRINEENTKYKINTRNKVRFKNKKHLQIYNYKFERVGEFKYLGSMITEHRDNNTEIKARITAGNSSYYSVLPLLRSKAVSRTTKIRMYKTIIRPVVLYGSEAWCLTANGEKILCIWERKVLRKIFGQICVAGYWRSRTNEEVRQLYRELDIVTEIKTGRLRWLGHVERMSEERVVKRLYQNTPEGSRSVGRLRLRWMDDVREDQRRLGVTKWRIRAHRRLKNGREGGQGPKGLCNHGVVVVVVVVVNRVEFVSNRMSYSSERSMV